MTWCKANPTAAWENVLDGRVVRALAPGFDQPFAVAIRRCSFFAKIYSKDFSGVVKVDALSSRYTKIMRLRIPVNYQAFGHFDGRWLVWAESTPRGRLRDFTVWSWDSRTGRVRRIGTTTRPPSGEFWPLLGGTGCT